MTTTATSENLKLFVSYAHEDMSVVERFVKHLRPLEQRHSISIWWDRINHPGSDFIPAIDTNLDNSDIVLLCLTSDYLNSRACLQEARSALNQRDTRCVIVIPIILSECGWKDIDSPRLSHLLALPTDGQAVSCYGAESSAFQDIYNSLTGILTAECKIRRPILSSSFEKDLGAAGMLANVGDSRQELTLDDIFVYPTLIACDPTKDDQKLLKADKLLSSITSKKRILISGENQSGKTGLAKTYFRDLLHTSLLPVLIRPRDGQFNGTCRQLIAGALAEQYTHCTLEDIDLNRIVLIIDDFHQVHKKDKIVRELEQYPYQIIFIDDIVNVDVREETLLRVFFQYRIRQFSPSERYALIKKWTDLSTTEKNNAYYQVIDEKIEMVESTLGKVFGNGIMPAYPFFILSVTVLQEAAGSPLDQEITSQGYCYQALIYYYLRRAGVNNEDVDTYVNFLSVLAVHIYKTKRRVNEEELNAFFVLYEKKYNLPFSRVELLKQLSKATLFTRNNLGEFAFSCKYLGYFFTARYIAEHYDSEQDTFSQMVSNMHIDENSYVLIFIAHHTRMQAVIDQICQYAITLFSNHSASKLTSKELGGFETQCDLIVKAVLPEHRESPDVARQEHLNNRDNSEATSEETDGNGKDEDVDVRRFVRVSEVLGRIAKNRAGSFERSQLKYIVETLLNLHARFITSFVSIATDAKTETLFISLVDKNLEKDLSKRENKHAISIEARKKLAKTIFWNINFWILKYVIGGCISSIGSKKLRSIIDEVCDHSVNNSAFNSIVKHGIHMWNCKDLEIANILTDMNDFSEIAKRLMRSFVVDYGTFHRLDFATRQSVEKAFDLSANTLIHDYERAKRS